MCKTCCLPLILVLLLPASSFGQAKVLDVWPGKAPGDPDSWPEERATKSGENGKPARLENVSKPTLSVFHPAKDKHTGTAVIIFPGGGYNHLAWAHEGEEVAAWLNELGVTGIVLKYRVPRRPDFDAEKAFHPLMDAQRAIRLVRSKAQEWGLDARRIGILGFSAGGHLAASASTRDEQQSYAPLDEVDRVSARPDFAVLIYPAYLVARTEAKPGLSAHLKVTKETPPTLLVHAADDPIPADNSLQYFTALRQAGVSAELHIYSRGGHGFGMRKSDNPVAQWPQRCADWLRIQGYLQK